MPSSSRFKPVVKVVDIEPQNLLMLADVVSQRLMCSWVDSI
jgi:hypothetical protein